MPFTYEMIKSKDGIESIRVTGHTGQPSRLYIPAEIDGLPVTEVGPHAFKNRMELVEAVIPEGVSCIKSYAFHNCGNLRTLSLYDGVELYYDGVIKHCEKLDNIIFYVKRDDFTVLRQLTQDNDTRMTITIVGADYKARIILPSYVYDFDADDMARAIHHRIEGAGYAYRECLTKKGINYSDYDHIFKRAIADDPRLATEVCADRLAFPYMLSEEAGIAYEAFVRDNDHLVAEHLAVIGDEDGLKALGVRHLLSNEAIRSALDNRIDDKIRAILMDSLEQTKSSGFSLEDF